MREVLRVAEHGEGWGVGVRYALADYVSASLHYDSIGANTKGYVLLFDADWRLTAVRKGYLRDLTFEFARPRPAHAQPRPDLLDTNHRPA